MTEVRRTAAYCGLLAPAIGVATVLLAAFLAPPADFSWSERAISDLGRLGAATFWLFNGGLLGAAVVALPFAWRLAADARNGLERLGAACFGLAAIGMGLVGVFFLEHTAWYLTRSLHGPAALLFFAMAPAATLASGLGSLLAGDRRWGVLSVGLGVAHLLSWAVWILFVTRLASGAATWFALQETVVVLLFACWTALAARRTLRNQSARTTA